MEKTQLEKFNAKTTPLGTKLITRDGREVSEWYYFESINCCWKVHAIVQGRRYSYTIKGRYRLSSSDNLDLFIKPKVREIWKNVYKSSDGTLSTGADFFSKEEAIYHKQRIEGYIKTIRITDEIE